MMTGRVRKGKRSPAVGCGMRGRRGDNDQRARADETDQPPEIPGVGCSRGAVFPSRFGGRKGDGKGTERGRISTGLRPGREGLVRGPGAASQWPIGGRQWAARSGSDQGPECSISVIVRAMRPGALLPSSSAAGSGEIEWTLGWNLGWISGGSERLSVGDRAVGLAHPHAAWPSLAVVGALSVIAGARNHLQANRPIEFRFEIRVMR